MAVDAFLFVARTGVYHRPVGQHGAPLGGHVQQVAMAFLALAVVETGVGILAGFRPVVFTLEKMHRHVLDPVIGRGEKEVEGVLGRRQVAVHAVHHHTGGIVGVGGRPPGHDGRFDLVAGGTELRCGGAHHGVVAHAEQGKGQQNAQKHEGPADDIFFHDSYPAMVGR